MTHVVTQEVLYIYYKVALAQHAALALRVQAFQAQLQQDWPGLVTELLQRPQATAGVETWMETYRCTQGLSAALLDAIAQAAVASGLPAPRHAESFVPLR